MVCPPIVLKKCILFMFFSVIQNAAAYPTDGSQFQFEDDWDYKISPHSSPLINGPQRHFLLPHYTFSKDLKVEGLKENETISVPSEFRESKIVGDIVRTKISCGVCNLGVGLLFQEVKGGTRFEEIKEKFVSLCVSFKIETVDVCSGIFDIYGPEVVPAVEITTLGPLDICKLIFGETCGTLDVPEHKWTVELPEKSNRKDRTAGEPKLEESAIFKVLHISDTHYDPRYEEGSVSNCEEPLCCRGYSSLRVNEEPIPAGRWGSYEKCDAPKALLENMFRHIALEHPDTDFLIWTGDLPAHDIWNQTKQFNLDVIKDTVEMLFNVFPDKAVFPAIGNHESSPAGNFAPPWMKDESHSIAWLYKEIAEHWAKWLPSSSGNTVYRGAFYSVLLRPGFRLISVNTNYCHSLSWWLLINSTDPASELKWLVYELQEAENKGEKVHIIGHIPPGSSDCMKMWSENFYEIVNRYEDTITGLFYGHSHADEFEVFYETANYSRPTAVAYLTPSVSTYTNYNPAYRIYYINSSTFEVLDHETWTFDLDQANEEGNSPIWYKLYSARDTYQLKNLKPSEWDKLINAMNNDDELFNKFYRNYYRDASKMPLCDKKCKLQILCDLKTAKSHSRRELCHDLQLNFGT